MTLRVLLVSLECSGKVVSGNGVYASTVRRALMASALVSEVLVLCGAPSESCSNNREEEKGVLFVPLSSWGR